MRSVQLLNPWIASASVRLEGWAWADRLATYSYDALGSAFHRSVGLPVPSVVHAGALPNVTCRVASQPLLYLVTGSQQRQSCSAVGDEQSQRQGRGSAGAAQQQAGRQAGSFSLFTAGHSLLRGAQAAVAGWPPHIHGRSGRLWLPGRRRWPRRSSRAGLSLSLATNTSCMRLLRRDELTGHEDSRDASPRMSLHTIDCPRPHTTRRKATRPSTHVKVAESSKRCRHLLNNECKKETHQLAFVIKIA